MNNERLNGETESVAGSGRTPCYAFSYHMTLMCKIAGRDFEFHKEFRFPVQLRVGDHVYVNGLENVPIATVVWYLDNPGHAFVELMDQECSGSPKDWECICDDMSYSVPDLDG